MPMFKKKDDAYAKVDTYLEGGNGVNDSDNEADYDE
jgi:hypothetical protein